jgi:hypothetical protein
MQDIYEDAQLPSAVIIGRPTSGVAQRSMREAAPHAHGVSKATLRRLAVVKIR